MINKWNYFLKYSIINVIWYPQFTLEMLRYCDKVEKCKYEGWSINQLPFKIFQYKCYMISSIYFGNVKILR